MSADEIARILDTLGERLGPAGEYAFGLAVRQAFIDGLLATAMGLVATVVLAAVTVLVLRRVARIKPDEYRHEDTFDVVMPLLMGTLVFSVPVAGIATLLLAGVPKLLNPEYAALTDLLSRIVP